MVPAPLRYMHTEPSFSSMREMLYDPCTNAVGERVGTPLPEEAMARLARQADDPVLRAMWGLGDEVPGGARRRARVSWAAFSSRQRLRYGAWLASRALVRPFEARAARRQAAARAGNPVPTGGVMK